jgi:predicted nuclease with TOPRIM domain
MDLKKSTVSCKQCENPMLKGLHTCEKRRVPSLRAEVDRLRSENEYLRDELRKTEQRISDLQWRVNPDRMGR